MAAPVNYVKVGLFVVLGLVAAAALAIAVGVTKGRKKTIAYYTYFNESVTGLDVGAPVKARGVNVGHVGEITFAPDRRLIQVRMDMEEGILDRFGGEPVAQGVPPDLRAQLSSQGVTGSTFVSIDFFDPKTNPVLPLSFQPGAHYIPAAKSQIKNVVDSITTAMDGLASLVDTLSREGLSEKLLQATTNVNDILSTLEQFLQGLDRQQIPKRAAKTIDQLLVDFDKVSRVLDRVDGEAGLLATAQRSVSSFGDVGRNATGATRDLDATLGELRETLAAIRRLADELEREPDVLLKGRARGGTP